MMIHVFLHFTWAKVAVINVIFWFSPYHWNIKMKRLFVHLLSTALVLQNKLTRMYEKLKTYSVCQLHFKVRVVRFFVQIRNVSLMFLNDKLTTNVIEVVRGGWTFSRFSSTPFIFIYVRKEQRKVISWHDIMLKQQNENKFCEETENYSRISMAFCKSVDENNKIHPRNMKQFLTRRPVNFCPMTTTEFKLMFPNASFKSRWVGDERSVEKTLLWYNNVSCVSPYLRNFYWLMSIVCHFLSSLAWSHVWCSYRAAAFDFLTFVVVRHLIGPQRTLKILISLFLHLRLAPASWGARPFKNDWSYWKYEYLLVSMSRGCILSLNRRVLDFLWSNNSQFSPPRAHFPCWEVQFSFWFSTLVALIP